jgi:hypothetical protein
MAIGQTWPMATRRDRRREAERLAAGIRLAIGSEIRDGRLMAGISQGLAGAAVGMSHAQFGGIERGALQNVTVEQLCLALFPQLARSSL